MLDMKGDVVTIRALLGILLRVAVSLPFAGIFYTGWMAVAIPALNSDFGGIVVQILLWILAPIVTALGFAVGPTACRLLGSAGRSHFWETYKWCLIGCAIGGGVVCIFGPMLIVFGMFVGGTLSVVLHEARKIRRQSTDNKAAP